MALRRGLFLIWWEGPRTFSWMFNSEGKVPLTFTHVSTIKIIIIAFLSDRPEISWSFLLENILTRMFSNKNVRKMICMKVLYRCSICSMIVMFVSLMFQVITLNRKPSLCLLHVSYQRATVTITIMSWKTFFCKYIQKWPWFQVSVCWCIFLPLLSV